MKATEMKMRVNLFGRFRSQFLLAALLTGASASAIAGSWHEHRIDAGGKSRLYQVYRPTNMRDGAPAVMVLHGGSQSMRKLFGEKGGATLVWIDIAEREGAVLIAPNGTSRRNGDPSGDTQAWNDFRDQPAVRDVDDVAFLRRVILDETLALKLDPKRIYITGASNGGMMTFRMLIEAPELFAGGAAFIANLPDHPDRLPRPSQPTPIMIVNGTKDPLVKWEGGVVAGDEGRGVTVSTTETVAWWVNANGANPQVTRRETLPDINRNDGCRITLDVHGANRNGAPVWLYTAIGGGHTMPSIRFDISDSRIVRRFIGTACKDAEGAELAWRFFAMHSRNAAR
jgi:polyhydroxybutyrate depolymerase